MSEAAGKTVNKSSSSPAGKSMGKLAGKSTSVSHAGSKAEAKAFLLRLQVDNEVARRIRQHARSSMKTEVCGVLIGEVVDGQVEVLASIEGTMAAQAGTHVTFTQDAWEAIYKVKDVSYPEERIVGWYHSHPGFGVFLSEHDMFIHRNFFSSPDQVAWVYDPHTDEEGCFGWHDGEIHRVPSFGMVDHNGDGTERTPKEADSHGIDPDAWDDDSAWGGRGEGRRSETPVWLRWSVTALSYLSALVVGFLVAYFLFPRLVGIPIDPFTGEPLPLHRGDMPGSPDGSGQPTSPGAGAPSPSGSSSTPLPAPATPTPDAAPGGKK